MTSQQYVLWLVIPATGVWALTVADIVRRQGLTGRQRAAWALAVTVAFPVALVWHLARPVVPPAAVPLEKLDPVHPRVRLVTSVVARRRGQLDPDAYARVLDDLLPPPGPPRH